MSITIHIDAELGKRKFAALSAAVRPEAMLRGVKLRLEAWVGENFTRRGTENPWPALAPLTLMLRKRGGDVPLQDTGEFRKAMVSKIEGETYFVGWPGTLGNHPSSPDMSLARLAVIHHRGTGPIAPLDTRRVLRIPNPHGPAIFLKSTRGIPARPLLPSHGLARKLVRETLEAALQNALGRGQTGGGA